MLDWGGGSSGGRLLGLRGAMAGAMEAGAGAGYSLRWNNHQHHILNAFDALLQDEALVDVTLVCEEGRVRAHKVVLSACSPYFQRIFSETPCKHPVIVLKDLRGWEVQAIVDFMYKGEISVSQAQLPSLIRAAESLQVRGLAHMEKEQMSSSSAATMTTRGVRLEAPESPPVVSSAPLSSTRPYSPAPSLEKLGLYPGTGSRGTENGPLLMSSPFSPSPAPHFEPSPMKQTHHHHHNRNNDNASPPIHCRDPHRSSPLPRRKQARPRRRSGELSAHDLSKSSATSSPASSPSDIPENLCVKKQQHHHPGSPPLHGHPSAPHSPRPPSSIAIPPPSFSPPPPSQPSSAPSLPHSPTNTVDPLESPLTPSSNDMLHKAPSSLPADLTPSERLLDFSMNGSPAPHHPTSLGLTHPGSAPPHFSWDPPLDSSGFPMLPSVSAMSLTPPHVFSMESAQLGLFPPMDGCRNSLLNDLQESRHDNHILSKRKLGRPKGQHSAPRGGPPRSWTNAELTEALQHVWNKKMTTSQASRIFGIPYNSLLMYVRGKYGKSLKLEQLKKDCLVGAEMHSAPSPGSGGHHPHGGGRGGGGDKHSDELSISSTGPEPDLGFNPYANFYSDFAFPIPVSMIHLLPQSEKNREFPSLDDDRRDDGDESANEEDRKPTHNGQK